MAFGLAATAAAVPSVPAGGSDLVDGSLVFAGTASLPTFPCPPPEPETFPCEGTFTASTAGTLTGVHESAPWQVSLNSITEGTFSYVDLLEPGVPCSEGLALGTASFDTDQNGQAFGTYRVQPSLLPVRGAAASYSFAWRRVGAAAILELDRVTFRLKVDELGWVTVVSQGTADAVATFVPHVDPAEPPGCVADDPTSLNGSFAGNVIGIETGP